MKIEKWNGKEYVKETIPDGKYIANTDNMEELTKCPCCGEMIPFGDTYTSGVYFFSGGVFGMNVCDKCKSKELHKLIKYRWRELLKDPDDLPEHCNDVEVVNDDGIHAIARFVREDVFPWKIKYCLYDDDIWDSDEQGFIVAWREIEPFNPEYEESDDEK